MPKQIKEQVTSELVKKAVALLLLLVSTLVLALVPPVRDRVLPVLPKPLLAAILGLSLSLNLGSFFYVLHLRRSLKQKLTSRFGVLWSKDIEPHCSVCKVLFGFGMDDAVILPVGVPGFAGFAPEETFLKCFKCKYRGWLVDDEGRVLTLKEAKSLIAASNLK